MDAFSEAVIGMAGGACLDHSDLIPFPRGYLMDLCVTVFTLYVVDKMGTCIMLCPFLLVATMAGDRLRMDSPPLGFHMSVDVGDVPMATIARIGSVHGLGELPLTDFGVATEAFRVIDTLKTIFTTLDNKLLSLFRTFTFRRLGDPRRFRTLFSRCRRSCPEDFVAPKEGHRNGDKDENSSLKHRLRSPPKIELLDAQSFPPLLSNPFEERFEELRWELSY
jgi:hypothetical protein